jgi:hypothetical protein
LTLVVVLLARVWVAVRFTCDVVLPAEVGRLVTAVLVVVVDGGYRDVSFLTGSGTVLVVLVDAERCKELEATLPLLKAVGLPFVLTVEVTVRCSGLTGSLLGEPAVPLGFES